MPPKAPLFAYDAELVRISEALAGRMSRALPYPPAYCAWCRGDLGGAAQRYFGAGRGHQSVYPGFAGIVRSVYETDADGIQQRLYGYVLKVMLPFAGRIQGIYTHPACETGQELMCNGLRTCRTRTCFGIWNKATNASAAPASKACEYLSHNGPPVGNAVLSVIPPLYRHNAARDTAEAVIGH